MTTLTDLAKELLPEGAAAEETGPTIDERVLEALLKDPAMEWARAAGTGSVPTELKNEFAALFKAAGFKGADGALERARTAYLGLFPGESQYFDMVYPRSVSIRELCEAGLPEDVYGEDVSGHQRLLTEAQAFVFAQELAGGLKQSVGTACYLLRTYPALAGGPLEFNEMTSVITIGRKEIRDEDVTRLREQIELRFLTPGGKPLQFKKDLMWDAAQFVAMKATYHPVRDYLGGLVWDGEKRLDRVAAEILKAEANTISATMFRKFAIACVARAMRPGTKVDNMLVLQGAQGIQKSTFFKTLAGEDWFTDAYIDFENPKHLMTMRTAWIAEFAEMKSLLNAQSEESVKAGLTRTEDRYVPPYGRAPVTFKRHTAFGGTTNPSEILRDPTGNRRYWPITIGGEIDLQKLSEWRDQLWAEAVVAYKLGEKWWFTDSADNDALGKVQANYMREDPWEKPVLDWVEAHCKEADERRSQAGAKAETWPSISWTGAFTIGQVMEDGLKILAAHQNAMGQSRVKTILVTSGYSCVRPSTPKGSKRRTYYVQEDLADLFKQCFSDELKRVETKAPVDYSKDPDNFPR